MTIYKETITKSETPQSEALLGEDQVKNNAGGYVYGVTDMERVRRFLILGTEGGTYYVQPRKLTKDNCEATIAAIKSNGIDVLREVVELRQTNRLPKLSPAILTLALAFTYGDIACKRTAEGALPVVCKTASHLMEFVSYIEELRGWGRLVRRAVSNWYNEKDPADAMFQVLKYRERNGWRHRDILRVAHPLPRTDAHSALFKYITKGTVPEDADAYMESRIEIFTAMRSATTSKEVASLIEVFNAPREWIPTELLKEKGTWEALLPRMPATALVRNLATMTRVGALAPLRDNTDIAVNKLVGNSHSITGKIHPMQFFLAMMTYDRGKSARGSNEWKPIPQITAALDYAMEQSFQYVPPTNKRFYIGLDVSGSMEWEMVMDGSVSCLKAGAALCAIIARTEPNYFIAGFSADSGSKDWATGTVMQEIGINSADTILSATDKAQRMDFGRTDCSLPMRDALARKIPVDCFVVITDNETWAGPMHATQALKEYRKGMGIDAKLIVVGMTATNFTIADPKDTRQLDVVGFDAALPKMISEFAGS